MTSVVPLLGIYNCKPLQQESFDIIAPVVAVTRKPLFRYSDAQLLKIHFGTTIANFSGWVARQRPSLDRAWLARLPQLLAVGHHLFRALLLPKLLRIAVIVMHLGCENHVRRVHLQPT